jgi:hypothetical protein
MKKATDKNVKIRKEKVAELIAKKLLESVKEVEGLQYKLRQAFSIHGSHFSQKNAFKLSKNHFAEIVGGAAIKDDKKAFMMLWMATGEKIWDRINENEEEFEEIKDERLKIKD